MKDGKDSCLLDGDDEICSVLKEATKKSWEYGSPLRIIRVIQRISLGVAREYNWAKSRFTFSLLLSVVALLWK